VNIYVNASGGDAKSIASAVEDAVISVLERYQENKVRVAYGQ